MGCMVMPRHRPEPATGAVGGLFYCQHYFLPKVLMSYGIFETSGVKSKSLENLQIKGPPRTHSTLVPVHKTSSVGPHPEPRCSSG